MVMQFDPLDPSDSYKFEILKIREGGGRHFEKKSKIHRISATMNTI